MISTLHKCFKKLLQKGPLLRHQTVSTVEGYVFVRVLRNRKE